MKEIINGAFLVLFGAAIGVLSTAAAINAAVNLPVGVQNNAILWFVFLLALDILLALVLIAFAIRAVRNK